MRFPTLVVCLMMLTACEPPFVERTTQITFAPGGDYWSVPLPSPLRKQSDGTLNLERWPGPRPQLVKMWLDTIDARLGDGWGVNAGAFFTVSGGGIDPASLPTAALSLTSDASIQFIDIDPASPEYGRRFPLDCSFTADAITYRPASMLAVTPVQGFPRRENTLYAVVLFDTLKDGDGQPLGASRAFYDALTGAKEANATARESLLPLQDFLTTAKLKPTKVIGATVFRTIDPNASLKKLSAWVETLPAPVLEQPWTRSDEYADFVVFTARYLVPHVQLGPRPGKGRIVWSADGQTPVQQGTQSVRLSVTIPKRALGANVPLTLYFHGSGGEYRELIDRGPLPPTAPRNLQGDPPLGSGPSGYLARRGIATMGFDFPLHGDRDTPPDTTGLRLYDIFGDVDSTVDNMNVAAMEATYLTRLLPALELPLPGGAGSVRVDMARLSAMGHSMGSTIGIPVATVNSRIKGYVFSGAGGLLIEVASETTYPVELRPTLELLLGFQTGEKLERSHPLLHAFQSLWDFTDPVAKARHVAKEPYEGQVPRPYFLPQGLVDGYFHPGAQAAVGGALGTTLLGEEVDATLPRALRLDGRGTSAAFPLRNNLNGVTAASIQLQTPFELGHFIMFDVPEVGAQVGCFLEKIGSPEGPAIVTPRALDAPCD